MAMTDRREVLRQLLAGVLQAGGAAVVVLATGPVAAGQQDETPLPAQDPTVQPQPTPELEQRVARVAGQAEEVPPPTGEEDSWINGGFRNFGVGGGLGGGFRNVGIGGGLGGSFRNVGLGGIGGGFRNGGFANGGLGGGGFRNVGVGGGFPGGGFHNAAFRNW